MKNKKAIEFRYLVIIIIGLITLVIAIFIVSDLLGREGAEVKSYLKDSDSDDIKDALDKCPCDPGEEAYDGCKEVPNTDRSCLES